MKECSPARAGASTPMIEHRTEHLIRLADAAKRLPRRRGGKRPSTSTLYRWGRHGLRGIKLETIRIGGTTCTSLEALQRFFERLTAGPQDAAGGMELGPGGNQ